jgi:hypothetical protein
MLILDMEDLLQLYLMKMTIGTQKQTRKTREIEKEKEGQKETEIKKMLLHCNNKRKKHYLCNRKTT